MSFSQEKNEKALTIIIAAGYNNDQLFTYIHFALARYQSNGNLDSSFGENGLQSTYMNGLAACYSAVLQKDGKIVLVGHTDAGFPEGSHIALARYIGDDKGTPFWVKVLRWIKHHLTLKWNTPDDDALYYVVERSGNGKDFTQIARVKNLLSNKQLQYTDATPLPDKNYYRIKQVNKEGNVSYTNIIAVAPERSPAVKLYPNPAKDMLQVQGLDADAKSKISIVDYSGNVMYAAETNTAIYTTNVSKLKPGTYYVKIQEGENISTVAFMKE